MEGKIFFFSSLYKDETKVNCFFVFFQFIKMNCNKCCGGAIYCSLALAN